MAHSENFSLEQQIEIAVRIAKQNDSYFTE